MYRKMFGFYKHESVRNFIYGLGRLDFFHIRLLLVYKLIIKSLASTNVTVTNLAHCLCFRRNIKICAIALVYRLTLWFQHINLKCFCIIVLKHSAFMVNTNTRMLYLWMYIFLCIYRYVCIFICVCRYVDACVYIYMYVYMYVYIYICMCIYHMCGYMYMYVCIYTFYFFQY